MEREEFAKVAASVQLVQRFSRGHVPDARAGMTGSDRRHVVAVNIAGKYTRVMVSEGSQSSSITRSLIIFHYKAGNHCKTNHH